MKKKFLSFNFIFLIFLILIAIARSTHIFFEGRFLGEEGTIFFKNAYVKIIVYDLSGKHFQTLINKFQTSGYHNINWNANNNPSGIYFVHMTSDGFVQTQKVILMK